MTQFGFERTLALNTGTPTGPIWSVLDVAGDAAIDDDSDEVEAARRSAEGRKQAVRSLLSRGIAFGLEAPPTASGSSAPARLLAASRSRQGFADVCAFDDATVSGGVVTEGVGIRFAALVKHTDDQPLGDRWLGSFELKPGRRPASWVAAGLPALDLAYVHGNRAPTITSNGGGPTAAIGVGTGETTVGTVTATDLDAGDTKTFSLNGGADAALFTINASTGALEFIDPAEVGTYVVIVRVTDSEGATDDQTVTVTVADPPEITSDGGGEIGDVFRSRGSAVTITTVEATGVGVVYSLGTTLDEELFAINPSTGVVTAATLAGDFHQIEVIATGVGGADSQTLRIYPTNGAGAAAGYDGLEPGGVEFELNTSPGTPGSSQFICDNESPKNFVFDLTPSGASALLLSLVGNDGADEDNDRIVFTALGASVWAGVHSVVDDGPTITVNTWLFDTFPWPNGTIVTVQRRPLS